MTDGDVVATGTRDGERRGWAVPVAVCVALTGLKLWLVSAQTLTAIAPAPADDELFLSLAESLLRGEWLGPAGPNTLAKGPVYPLWLALVHLSGLRLLVAQALLYAASCGVFVWAIAPALPRQWHRCAVYLVLLWNPASWADGPATRVIREGIYPALTLLVIGAAAGALLRLGRSRAAAWAGAAGLSGALLAMTREEGVWIAPSLGVLGILLLLRTRQVGVQAVLATAAIACVAYALPVTVVAAMNQVRYGVFTTSDWTGREVRNAFGALARVATPGAHPLVPVPHEARARIAEASPSFREVHAVLEARAPGWRVHGCKAFGVCDDIAGGWFLWALRDAVGVTGKYDRPALAREWYARVAQEVNEACGRGALACGPPRSSVMPPWRGEYLGRVVDAFGRGVKLVATMDAISANAGRPFASEPDLARFEVVTHERIPRDRLRVRVEVASALGTPRPVVLNSDLQKQPAQVVAAAAETDVGALPRYQVQVETPCTRGCFLVNLFDGGAALALPLDAEASRGAEGSSTWAVERFERIPEPSPPDRSARLAALDAVTRGFQLAMPPMLAVAVVLWSWLTWRDLRVRALRPITAIAAALGVGVVVRVLVLALVDTMSFPAIVVSYAAPAYPLALAFVAVALAVKASPRGEVG